ncbi:sugar ABC transporter substrate-binding protein [Aquabacterium olei]|uniref:Sugar ABC transporter substrate-binding protein n=1 Tax=Aquabacterium olei TaxID=1296669 RepID=A0A2U8FM70_9BURK|nr:polysaccharide biosynthesis/export family protein [Aquabacterium olei]AWI52141.1 sugar ABC transporter substrate-binding protein [Aquabacterium olei]
MKLPLIALCLAALSACTPMGNLTPSAEMARLRVLTPADVARMAAEPTRVHPGDTLRIIRDAQDGAMDLRNLVEDSQTQLYVVRPDGSFSYRHAGRIQAGGKTPDELAQTLRERLASVYREPGVTINIVSSPSSKVVIGGAVRTPAAFDMSAVATVEQGLFATGGLLPTADPRRVALLRLDGAQRYQLYFIDFSGLLDGVTGLPTLAFRRGDILFVPKAWAGNMGDGVDVYINQLLPFTRSLGVSYSWGETKIK